LYGHVVSTNAISGGLDPPLFRNWISQQEGEVMKTSSVLKTLAVAVVLGGGSLLTTGCAKTGLENDYFAPPAYSSAENVQREIRYGNYDWSQAIDDFDRHVTLSRPSSTLTRWHIAQSD
jgi:hypothetical protein